MDEPTLADGTAALLGMRVYRCHPQDGTKRAGKRRGPMLQIIRMSEHQGKPNSVATLRTVKGDTPAGTEFIWNLRRKQGYQPNLRRIPKERIVTDVDAFTKIPRRRTLDTVRSFRLDPGLLTCLYARSRSYSSVLRRDIGRYYELLDTARERIIFPAGTIAPLVEAWRRAAPPPPHNQLKPQWFLPVILEALGYQPATPERELLIAFIRTWTPLDALAVQDVIERHPPETGSVDSWIVLGLREAGPVEPESQVATV